MNPKLPFRVWAIADLHLSFGVPNKEMDVFGPLWEDHADKIRTSWEGVIGKEDLVLIPGDISWAMRLEEVVADLNWIDTLPGVKVMIKGNHDYWWGSLKKIAEILPPSIHLIQNNAFHWKEVAIGGARLWDTPEYSFEPFIEAVERPETKQEAKQREISLEEVAQEDLSQKIFDRELHRLEMSLQQLDRTAKVKIAMTHYPPIGADLAPSRASQILEESGIEVCVFGHLHSVKADLSLFGKARGIRYVLASADYLRFQPVALL